MSVVPTQVELEVTADASGSSGSGTLRYTFDFGDGAATFGPQTGGTAKHSYTATGTRRDSPPRAHRPAGPRPSNR
ncbi:PKD domain-containing protein [Pseudofrankia sp. DC12]|uniref:PKD domain-containing protein n=1 Tax=Pseudofrankia sp. DC12 TaxID=683315 RepID=UPI0005F823FF|nr:PKD domain-containing protein [Pseudofrankia sp. DC12]